MASRSRGNAFRLAAIALLASAFAGCGRAPTPSVAPAIATEAVRAPKPAFEWRDAVLYFALIDRFADGDSANDANVDRTAKGTFHGGDLAGLTAHLDEIASLGVNAIWINPVVKNIDGFVTGAGFPDWAYHGYWADDFLRIDRRFGNEEQLDAFVDACHRRGIKVLLDVVYNHAGYGSRYLTDPRTKDWFRTEERGTCGQDDVTSCVAGLPDFETERPEVAKFLLDAQLGWAKRANVDGFRLDTVKHLAHPFWQEHRRRTRAELGNDFFLLGEVWGGDRESLDPWFEPDELDAGFDFGFGGSAVGFLLGRGRAVAFDRYLASREKVRAGHLLAQFLSSHDVKGALSELGFDTALFRLAAVLEMTVSGIPTIYYGEEVARRGGDWPDNRSDMPWGERKILPGEGAPRDEALRAFYTKLIGIRRAHPALARGRHAALSTEGDAYVYARQDAAETLAVAVNRSAEPRTARFTAPASWSGKEVVDLLGGAAPRTSGGEIELEMEGKGARILAAR